MGTASAVFRLSVSPIRTQILRECLSLDWGRQRAGDIHTRLCLWGREEIDVKTLSPEDSFSDCSEGLLRRGKGGAKYIAGLPGGAEVKTPPANAVDTSSSPGPGRSHMPWSNSAHTPQLLSLRSRTQEPQLLSPHATTTEAHMPRARAPQQEKPLQ